MSEPLRRLARAEAVASGIDPDRFERQIEAESSFRPGARSPSGATGIAQIMPATAVEWGVDPSDAASSLRAATTAMAGFLREHGDWGLALAAYNAGPGMVRRCGGMPPFAETRAYAARVLGDGQRSGERGGQVALTFHQVPSRHSGRLLDALRRHGARATFFVEPDAVAGSRSVLGRIVREGHELALRCWAGEIARSAAAVRDASGVEPRLFRPRGWPFDAAECRRAHASGLAPVGWTLGPKNGSREEASWMRRPLARAATDGSIVLLPGGGERGARTPEAVDSLLADLARRSYRFPTLGELLGRSPAPSEWRAIGKLAFGGGATVAG